MASLTIPVNHDAQASRTAWAAVLNVYACAFLQGLTLVSFPASSSVLKSMHGFGDAQYGAIFLPQVALTVLGALGGGALSRRLGLKRLLVAGVTANALSQLALFGTVGLAPMAAFALVLAGTALMGLGFGLLGAPLNGYPPLFFPRRAGSAVVALHTLIGAGLAVGPLLAGAYITHWTWAYFPLTLLALAALLILHGMLLSFPSQPATGDAAGSPAGRGARATRTPAFWLLVSIAVIYAFAEGTFSNWAVIFLREAKGHSEMTAALGLSVFWAALVVGRLLTSLAVLRIPAERVWMALPLVMVAAFELLPWGESAALGIGLFALAGLGCSGFFPLTVALGQSRYAGEDAWVGSMLIAALMTGVGLGSFVIGPLREWLALERLYQLSAFYPLLALTLAALTLRVPRARIERAE